MPPRPPRACWLAAAALAAPLALFTALEFAGLHDLGFSSGRAGSALDPHIGQALKQYLALGVSLLLLAVVAAGLVRGAPGRAAEAGVSAAAREGKARKISPEARWEQHDAELLEVEIQCEFKISQMAYCDFVREYRIQASARAWIGRLRTRVASSPRLGARRHRCSVGSARGCRRGPRPTMAEACWRCRSARLMLLLLLVVAPACRSCRQDEFE